jgi:hypothetical protein
VGTGRLPLVLILRHVNVLKKTDVHVFNFVILGRHRGHILGVRLDSNMNVKIAISFLML